ncbi:MAG: hypothetical protein R3A48_17320 [Polyangiales bacterium]
MTVHGDEARRRRLVGAATLTALLLLGAWSLRRGGEATRAALPPAGDEAGLVTPPRETSPPTAPVAPAPVVEDAGVVAASVRDRALRDRIRAAIVRAWRADAGAPPEGAGAEPAAVAAIPARAGTLDARYLRERIREDFLPMASACYDSLLQRRPAGEGRVTMEFEIVADANLGGLVEDARFVGDAGAPDAGVWEGEFLTCMRESMMTVAFLRPEGDGRMTVRYPFRLSPSPDGGRE